MSQSTPRKSSFPPVVDSAVRVLICGSLPGDRSLAARQYYAHPQNQFWRLMSAVVDRDLTALAYPERLAALLEAHVGLWDVVATAHRPGSTDAALSGIAPNDIAALAATLPDLRAIAFNGGTALKHGLKQLGATRYATVALPSSSPLHTVGFDRKLPAWVELRDHLRH
ncbi:DNA-deoxyinosine glycosylase [Sphingomonas koreensis]|uniref:DNA-deoxyinosine glycosylase n=1 Tax=Sphingomonas koreensis TaxID=93064 RepID=A0A1L6JEB6_9SPHN|nr:DNA-deoxyinosine glycosylase [Sphingomonas koreensis]APR54263.1 DNA-deoxyinosine glycosylase [Sphingomonas koreensis]MDC7809275.1 DNA-deoxyinosine glycosylase [Sphingomonas koreensis]RSU18529.1 DNA-deoxyinosine glycosylase [Sphingomonas koreensis]RSU22421.1 DNA-deoxyinosine glycosylase [Sphingomonas koreensis]RSU23971.1 DNA-deoxyinosine glycosylase [Sphingomonas koreensis]